MLTNVRFAMDFTFGGGVIVRRNRVKSHLAEPWDNESKPPRINPEEP